VEFVLFLSVCESFWFQQILTEMFLMECKCSSAHARLLFVPLWLLKSIRGEMPAI